MTQLRKCCTKLFIVIIGSKREILIPIDNQGARDFAKFDRNRNNSYTWNPSPGYGQVSREIKASISFLFRWSLDRAAASLVTLAPRFVAHYFDQPRVSPPILRRFEESGRTRPYIRRLFFLFFFSTGCETIFRLHVETGRSHFASIHENRRCDRRVSDTHVEQLCTRARCDGPV